MPMRQYLNASREDVRGSREDLVNAPVINVVAAGAGPEDPFSSDGTETESLVPVSQRKNSNVLTAEGQILRKQLRFFFMNPWQKWKARRQFPWKLFFQVLKIVLVTVELCLFGEMRMNHIQFLETTKTVLRHRFLKDWQDTRDVGVYPPPAGPYAVYTKDQFFDRLGYAIGQFYVINSTSLNTFVYDYNVTDEVPPVLFCYDQYRVENKSSTGKTIYKRIIDKRCSNLSFNSSERAGLLSNDTAGFMQSYLREHNFTFQATRFVSASLSFGLKTVRINHMPPKDKPDCFRLGVSVVFDGTSHTGQVPVKMQVDANFINDCKFADMDKMLGVSGLQIFITILDPVVLVLCLLSLILCSRALIRAYVLSNRTRSFFRSMGETLDLSDRLEFVNIWYILIVINDCLILLGTAFKWSIEFTEFDSTLFTAAGILLGSGILLVWTGVLRYLGFFPHYNVLILTLKKSLPNVIRFLLCAAILYCGFLFCGWIVLGPYSIKFKDLLKSSETLFALINGDDMFATFYTISDDSPAAKWFGRIYLYVFIAIFIYVVLSLFISIIMDAYEVIKEKYDPDQDVSKLRRFLADLSEDRSASGSADMSSVSDPLDNCSACPDCLRLLINKARGRPTRSRSDYSEIGSSAQ